MRSEGATAISQPEGTLDEVPLGDAGSPMNKAPLREVPKPSNNSSLGRTPQPCCVGCFGAPPAPAPPKQRVSVSEEEDEDEAKDGLGGTNHLIRRLFDRIFVYLIIEAPCDVLRLSLTARMTSRLNILPLHVLTMAELERPLSSAGTSNSFVIPPLRALGASARNLSRRFNQSMSDLFFDAEEPGTHTSTFLCYGARGGGPCNPLRGD